MSTGITWRFFIVFFFGGGGEGGLPMPRLLNLVYFALCRKFYKIAHISSSGDLIDL